MLPEGLAGIGLGTWKQIGLLACFGMFMIVALRLLFARRGKYDAAARMPLDDGTDGEDRQTVKRGTPHHG